MNPDSKQLLRSISLRVHEPNPHLAAAFHLIQRVVSNRVEDSREKKVQALLDSMAAPLRQKMLTRLTRIATAYQGIPKANLNPFIPSALRTLTADESFEKFREANTDAVDAVFHTELTAPRGIKKLIDKAKFTVKPLKVLAPTPLRYTQPALITEHSFNASDKKGVQPIQFRFTPLQWADMGPEDEMTASSFTVSSKVVGARTHLVMIPVKSAVTEGFEGKYKLRAIRGTEVGKPIDVRIADPSPAIATPIIASVENDGLCAGQWLLIFGSQFAKPSVPASGKSDNVDFPPDDDLGLISIPRSPGNYISFHFIAQDNPSQVQTSVITTPEWLGPNKLKVQIPRSVAPGTYFIQVSQSNVNNAGEEATASSDLHQLVVAPQRFAVDLLTLTCLFETNAGDGVAATASNDGPGEEEILVLPYVQVDSVGSNFEAIGELVLDAVEKPTVSFGANDQNVFPGGVPSSLGEVRQGLIVGANLCESDSSDIDEAQAALLFAAAAAGLAGAVAAIFNVVVGAVIAAVGSAFALAAVILGAFDDLDEIGYAVVGFGVIDLQKSTMPFNQVLTFGNVDDGLYEATLRFRRTFP